ncbi:MAG: hypothetical protein WBE76_19125 [Terracidiphilus sp.]
MTNQNGIPILAPRDQYAIADRIARKIAHLAAKEERLQRMEKELSGGRFEPPASR